VAAAAGLRYVGDWIPGIRRRRHGKGFTYRLADGGLLRHPAALSRIRRLRIPPAWRDVWICPLANGHLQVTARDARGRKQYRYHDRWREVRDGNKFDRLACFGLALRRLRASVAADLELPGLPRAKVLATVVRLMDLARIRVGNERYTRDNGSFGATTLRNEHVQVRGGEILLCFRGKSGKHHRISISDARLARVVRRCRDLPGYELFQYIDADGEVRGVDSGDVNDYIRSIAGDGFSAKDLRTWSGTVLAAAALCALGPARTRTQARSNVVRAVKLVAEQLGNTPAVCRKSYVHPLVVAAYLAGSLRDAPGEIGAVEEAVLPLLDGRIEVPEAAVGLSGSPRTAQPLQKKNKSRGDVNDPESREKGQRLVESVRLR
jgi:DNA topoisomerase-1